MLTSAENRVDYVGNGSTSVYPYTFRIFAASDLQVTQRDLAAAETTLTLNVHYTVSGVGAAAGGNVTLIAGNLTSGFLLTIRRIRALTQLKDIRNGGPTFPATFEDGLDHNIMISQQQQEEIGRSIHLPTTEAATAAATTMPSVAARAGNFLAFDASGNPIASSSLTTTTVPVSGIVQVVDTIAALKAIANPSGEITYQVRGYTAAGDGGGGLFRFVAGSSSTANDGTIIAPTVGTGRWFRIFDGDINVLWFGAVRCSALATGADSSAAFNAAIVAANTITGGKRIGVFVPGGIYRVHEIVWDDDSPLIGDPAVQSTLVYNGAGGVGSCILQTTTGDPVGSIENFRFEGWDQGAATAIAEYGYIVKTASGATQDWSFRMRSVQFVQFAINAIDMTLSSVINLHLDHLRFDRIYGWGMLIGGDASGENRPVSIARCTMDNVFNSAFLTRLIALGYAANSDATGKGFLYAEDCRGVTFDIRDCRIELNDELRIHHVQPVMIHNYNVVGGTTRFMLTNFIGYFKSNVGGVVVGNQGGALDLLWQGVTPMDSSFYRDYTDTQENISHAAAYGAYFSSGQQARGILLMKNALEFRYQVPTTSTIFKYFRKGDLVLASDQSTDGTHIGWKCTGPADGYGQPANSTLSTVAACVATSTAMSIPTGSLEDFMGRPNIRITGAGVASADLDTVAESVDVVTRVVTLKDAASTTINPTTVKINVPTFSKWGIQGEVQAAVVAALTDSSGGTANDTVQALTDPADTPASADALRDDLVANLIPQLRNNYADLAAKTNAILTALKNAKLMAS